jgi:hypothetical protein
MTSRNPGAYAMAYFRGQDSGDGEQVFLAVTAGSDPGIWLGDVSDSPQLVSQVGQGGVRDPFLFWDQTRQRYVLLATDLRVWPEGDWAAAVRFGSRSIVVWESTDLLTWTGSRLLEIAPKGAGNTWAPKAFWSEDLARWVIVFASAIYEDGDDRSVAQHQRLLFVTTQDFVTTSAPAVYSDPGHDVIDAALIQSGDWWYRFSANSHGGTPTLGKHIFMERGAEPFAPYWAPVAVDIGRDLAPFAEGPAVFRALDGTRWYLLIDDIFDRGYHLLTSTDLDAGRWIEVPGAGLPPGARHGSVVAITTDEAQQLAARLGHPAVATTPDTASGVQR